MNEPRHHLPANAWVGTVAGQGGWPLRAMLAEPQGEARGTLLFLNGRADFLEKYAETYPALTAARWRVAAFDWRGQGGSGRFPHTAKCAGHADFDVLLADLEHVWAWARPDVAIAHSMGAHLLVRHLANGARTHRAALLSPLFGLAAPAPMRLLARALARLNVARGRAGRFALGQQPYGAFQQAALRQTLLTHDPARFQEEHAWLARDPSLALGGVTWGWLDGFARSAAALTLTALARIATPLLILMPEQERLVSNAATVAAARHMPHATLETIPGAAHELLRETDVIREAVLARLLAFLS